MDNDWHLDHGVNRIAGLGIGGRAEGVDRRGKKEGKLVWWGTDGPPLAATIITSFNRRYPFIKVEYTKGIGTDFGDRLMMEADAGASSVDVVNGADSFLNQLLERGVLKYV